MRMRVGYSANGEISMADELFRDVLFTTPGKVLPSPYEGWAEFTEGADAGYASSGRRYRQAHRLADERPTAGVDTTRARGCYRAGAGAMPGVVAPAFCVRGVLIP